MADWGSEGRKPALNSKPDAGRVCGSQARRSGALPSTSELDSPASLASPSLSVGSSLYSLYTESSGPTVGLAASGPHSARVSDAALAAPTQVRAVRLLQCSAGLAPCQVACLCTLAVGPARLLVVAGM